MIQETLLEAIELSKKTGEIFIATADAAGQPHVAAAGEMRLFGESEITVTAWFCPLTLANLQVNRKIAFVIWDGSSSRGYQLIGEIKGINGLAMLDGYAGEREEKCGFPQAEENLTARIDKIVILVRGAHSDQGAESICII